MGSLFFLRINHIVISPPFTKHEFPVYSIQQMRVFIVIKAGEYDKEFRYRNETPTWLIMIHMSNLDVIIGLFYSNDDDKDPSTSDIRFPLC